jgi:hypothetical protein
VVFESQFGEENCHVVCNLLCPRLSTTAWP